MTWRGAAGHARARYRQIPVFNLVTASSTPVSPILRPDDGQITVFDDDDDLCRVSARRGHGPHGGGRRRAHSPADRARARREADVVVA